MGVHYGKYELIATLGRGGMADVYLAAMKGPVGFRKLVVIKRLRDDVADRLSYTTMLLDEAQLAARLQHPNVVQTFEVGVHERQHFIAMEFLEGQPIARILKIGGRPDWAFAARVMADALAGLEYAHTLSDYDGRPLSIVHRDVSPQNLFVTYAGEVKVVDFGVAKATVRVTEETEAGVLKGKLGYMAPEQLNNGTIDRRTDVFAAGIVLWELLTGRRLFRGESEGQAIALMLYKPVAPPSEIAGDIPRELDAICLRALERDPERRWQTAGDMREALYRFMEAQPGGAFRRDEIGRYVTSLFEQERAEVRARITDFMAEAEQDDAPRDTGSLRTLQVSRSDPAPDLPTLASSPTARSRSSPPAPQPPGAPVPPTMPANSATSATSAPSVPPSISPPPTQARPFWLPLALGAALVVAAGSVAAFALTRTRAPMPLPIAAAPDAGAPAPLPQPDVTLEGSGTIGVDAAPRILEEFFHKRGATVVRREQGANRDDVFVIATTPRGQESVLVRSGGTSTGFSCLAERTCDIAMAAREIRDAEAAQLVAKGVGDVRSPASEHVLALDGVAVVVNPQSPVRALDRGQIGAIFGGGVTDWSGVGGPPGQIAIFAHEDGSGTLDIFDEIVLGGRPIVASAKRMPDNAAISDAVAATPNAIGFVGMAFVRSARALAIGDRGVVPMIPSPFTVTTERYLLSRRFYLYTPAHPKPLAADIVEYAMSADAQPAIRAAGFTDLEVSLKSAEPCDACPPKYVAATKKARRLSLDFRFRTDGRTLDARAVRDVDRVIRFVHDRASSRVLLFGFCDPTGDAKADLRRSRELAQVVDAELAARGVRAAVVEGFGGELPIASSASDWGRAKNRRVEIWVEGR